MNFREASGNGWQSPGRWPLPPQLLLFDEPFGALDPITRHDMQQQFLKLRSQYKVTSVFVTHDIAEALTLSSRVAVLHQGKVEVVATPQEFFTVDTPEAVAFCDTLPPEMVAARHAGVVS